jgi:hypothetical protein
MNKFGSSIRKKTPAPNEWFGANGGLCPQTILWEFEMHRPPKFLHEISLKSRM